jgi:hypothetical protein
MKKTLFMDLKVGQTLSIDGGRFFITLEEKSGQRAKLRFVHDGAVIDRAPDGVPPDGIERRTGAAQARLGIKVAA